MRKKCMRTVSLLAAFVLLSSPAAAANVEKSFAIGVVLGMALGVLCVLVAFHRNVLVHADPLRRSLQWILGFIAIVAMANLVFGG